MSQNYEDIAAILKSSGLSVTKPRLLVFNLLLGQEPLTMHELYELSKGQLDRASLYRVVDIFEKLGVVKRINIGWKYKLELSDRFLEHHHHLTCLNCHKVIPISEAEFEGHIKEIADSHKFKPVEHQVEITGYCDNCSV